MYVRVDDVFTRVDDVFMNRRVYIALCFMNFYIILLILIEVFTWRNLYH